MEITSKEELLAFLTDIEGRLGNLQESFDNLQPVNEDPVDPESEDDETGEGSNEKPTDEVTEEELDEIEEMFQD